MRRVLSVFALLAACGGSSGPTVSTVTEITDACVDGAEIVVTFQGCLSSSCDTLTASSCTATESGGVVEVTGEATVTSEGEVCTADCGIIEARCAIPAGVDTSTAILSFGGDDGGPVLDDAGC